jgi:ABC-type uncharacterized transport system substrate-binding protein
MSDIRRREFLALLGCAAARPLAARAQQPEAVRRVGILISGGEADPEMQARVAAIRQRLDRLGWSEGRNLRIDIRFAEGDPHRHASLARELVARQPDAIIAYSTPIAAALRREAAASSLAVEVVPSPIENLADIERAIESLARLPNGGLVFLPDSTSIQHRDLVVVLAARHRLPAVYAFRFFVAAGGLMSYGTDIIEQYREAASYVDRILRGANPADLPVQAPTKYETVLNLKTASALGLEVPSSLLVRADEVIE